MRVMQLSNMASSLDGFTMEHNQWMICCGMRALGAGVLGSGYWAARAGLGAKRPEASQEQEDE